jgi:hypothetical protein
MRLAIAAAALLLAACGSAAGGCPASLPADVAASPGNCLQMAVVPGARAYAPGMDKITFTVTAMNISSQPCAGSSELVCGGPSLSVQDSGGKVVWNRQRPQVPCPLLIRLLEPGESMSTQVEWTSPGIGVGLYSVTGGVASKVVAGTATDFGRSYFSVC